MIKKTSNTEVIPKGDTAVPKFVKTPVANLYRGPAGNYYIRAKIGGKLVRRTLKTKNFEVAKAKLKTRHELERIRIAKISEDSSLVGCTVSVLMDRYLTKVNLNAEIKESTKRYHADCVSAMRTRWATLPQMNAALVTQSACEDWAVKMRSRYSPPRFNGMTDVLRNIFKLAVDLGLRIDNPAAQITKASVKQKELHLPSQAQFSKMLKAIDGHPYRKEAAVAIRFLAYTGMRTNEAGQVTAEMVDLRNDEFHLPGSITKNGEPRNVPIIAELKPMLKKLCQKPGPILPCRDPSKTLELACVEAGASRITNHDLRHLFVTRCIESGVDVKTVAVWTGHKDGGSLILKTYAHLRSEHSKKMAAKVKFSN